MTLHPHSLSRTYFIYCVGQELVTINAFKAAMAAAEIPSKPLLGRYKGKSEQSFISRMDDFEVILPWLNAEESYLHIHSFDARDRPKATLCYLSDGSEEFLGRFVPVERETAMQLEAFTYDPTYGQYFVCE